MRGTRQRVIAAITVWISTALGQAAERPNLLLFLADDMTYTDVGCFEPGCAKTTLIAWPSRVCG